MGGVEGPTTWEGLINEIYYNSHTSLSYITEYQQHTLQQRVSSY